MSYLTPGVLGIGIAVPSAPGHPQVAISVAGIADRLQGARLEVALARLWEAANAIAAFV